MTAQPTLIDHIAEAERIRAALQDANRRITQALRDRRVTDPAQRYVAAYDLAIGAVDDTIQGLWVLIEHLREAAPAAEERRLQAVLAEIVAEGHGVITLERRNGRSSCASYRSAEGMPETPSKGGTREEWARWEAEQESGRADDPDPLAAAQARLAQIRDLRAQQLAAINAIFSILKPIAMAHRYGLGPGDFITREEIDAEMAEARMGSIPDVPWCYSVSPGTAACGRKYEAITDRPENVTCPACREWVGENLITPESEPVGEEG